MSEAEAAAGRLGRDGTAKPMRRMLLISAAATTLAVFPSGLFASAIPGSWAKTMTNDPATNKALERYTRPLPDRAQETVRTLMLFRLLSTACLGVRSDPRPIDAFRRGSGLASLSADDLKTASRFAAAQFDGLDYRDLAQLCAGSGYLFGPRGALVRSAMTKGDGHLRFPYDEANPYITVKPFMPE